MLKDDKAFQSKLSSLLIQNENKISRENFTLLLNANYDRVIEGTFPIPKKLPACDCKIDFIIEERKENSSPQVSVSISFP
jgi:hypothetical protein